MIFYRLVSWLPLPLLPALSWPLYLFLYRVAGYRKTIVKQNLARAFPDRNETEITVLAEKFYRQLAQVALEVIKARRMDRSDFHRRVTLVNSELVRQYSSDFQDPVIILGIHQGNWEWMLHGIRVALDVPVDPIYKPLHNKTLDRLMLEIRSRFGSRPVAMADAAGEMLRRRGEFRLLIMLAEQSPIRRERSYWTEFMNGEAAFYTGAEVLAKASGSPLLFAECRRCATGRYEIEFRELARPPYNEADHAVTERYVRLAEQAIRSEPESWLWSNRRWKRNRSAEEEKN